MASLRVLAPASLSNIPRSSLSTSSSASVDTILKDFKVFSRHLRTVVSAQGNELHILERLYYKGKNQHRAALFWKRVAEIRKYGQRLDRVGICDIVERLRRSFFGEEAQHR